MHLTRLILAFTLLVGSSWSAAGGYTTSALAQSIPDLLLPGLQLANIHPSDGVASWGSPIALSEDGRQLWVVNPDAGSVTRLTVDPADGLLDQAVEAPAGQEPWSMAVAPHGQAIYVVDRAGGRLLRMDAQTLDVTGAVDVGPEPGAVALSPSGSTAYVSVGAAGLLALVDTARMAVTTTVPLESHPHAVAVTDDGDSRDWDETVVITHLLGLPKPGSAEATDDSRQGAVTLLQAGTLATRTAILAPNEHGAPGLLAGAAVSGTRVWIPMVRSLPALPNTLTQVVFAAVAAVDLETGQEDVTARLPLNDQEIFGSPVNNPVAAIPAPDGTRLYVVPAGSDMIEIVDIADPASPALVGFVPVGHNPRGMAVSTDGRFGYVMNYLSRSVTVLALEQGAALAETPVTAETLPPAVLLGKILFNNGTNPQLSRGAWVSCASCHPDGGSDGVTWIFPDGPRQTPPLWNAAATLPWHWSAALDEPQDVEETIHLIQHGLGLATGLDPALLAEPNAGRSPELDALAAFMVQGIRTPAAPQPSPQEQAQVAAGRDLFADVGCSACHGGDTWTRSSLPGAPGTLDPDGNGMVDAVLRDVGTATAQDIRGATGFDPPALLGVGLTAPYLHDGSAPNLAQLLAGGHPDPLGAGNGLNQAEIQALVTFLRTIDASTAPLP